MSCQDALERARDPGGGGLQNFGGGVVFWRGVD